MKWTWTHFGVVLAAVMTLAAMVVIVGSTSSSGTPPQRARQVDPPTPRESEPKGLTTQGYIDLWERVFLGMEQNLEWEPGTGKDPWRGGLQLDFHSLKRASPPAKFEEAHRKIRGLMDMYCSIDGRGTYSSREKQEWIDATDSAALEWRRLSEVYSQYIYDDESVWKWRAEERWLK